MINETSSIISEQSILGSLITEPFRIDDLNISANDFFEHRHKVVFSSMHDMAENNHAIDIVTLAKHIENKGELSSIGGLPFLIELAQHVGSSANIKRYAEIIKDKALIRELLEVTTDIRESCISLESNAQDLVSEAEAKIFAIGNKRETHEPVSINTAVDEALDHLGSVIDGLTYQSTGLTDLDALIGGLRGGATYIIAARSSMGKTALLCSIAHHVAQDVHCYIATLEMPRREIASRLMSIDGGVNLGNAKNWNDDDYTLLHKGAKAVSEMKITIDHEEGLTLAKLRSRCRRAKRKNKLGCIFVDYLQLMKSKADTREREIAQISEGLKSLAKELDVPVVALAQLNRDCDKRADKRPIMSDLRESGSIEQDADVIIMLYRDEVYDKDTQYKGMAELLVRKNRHGAIGDVYAQYNHPTMHFRDKAYDWAVPNAPVKQSSYRRGFD